MLWPFSKLFGEGHGVFTVSVVNGRSVLMRNVSGPKGVGRSQCKELVFPTERLTADQKTAWRESLALGAPKNPLTGRRLDPMGPTAAMLHVLAKRR